MVPWAFFANAVSQSSDSLVGSANPISKVYFPRVLIPLAVMLSSIVDFLEASSNATTIFILIMEAYCPN
jgi:lipopolysaccharide transport system permease protein